MKKQISNFISKYLLIIIIYILFVTVITDLAASVFKEFNFKNELLVSSLFNLLFYVVLLIIYFSFIGKDLFYEFKEYTTKKNKLEQLGLGYVILIGAGASGSFILILLGLGDTVAVNQQVIEQMMKSEYMLIVATAVIIGPIVEEIVFRKAIFSLFIDKWKFSPAVVLVFSSLLFGLIHVVFNLEDDIKELLQLIPYFTRGLALGYIYLANKRNLMYPVAVHLLNNFISVIIIIFAM